MYNLIVKELKLGVHPFFFFMPLLTGALMLIPGWLYFLVPLYFCFITVPNMFAGYKSQNDLLFTGMLPVTKNDVVKARVSVVVILEMLHIVIAIIFGIISIRLYPDLIYYFFSPTWGFWGLCFVMLAVFNFIFISMYFKTAYKYGAAAFASIIAAILFAAGAEWLSISNSFVFELFKGTGADRLGVQLAILIVGIAIFAIFTIAAYHIAIKRFEKVEL
ncbi:ABC-2 transporter permease [Paenibacillus sp. J5C_2022]|uniref:ABC-2 transporter permease n=1 Tax=Paenibacillus sp. J5C2022 TaxID=2977129 RepID=UPI0021D0DC89|nr:ABC-2 transporter permease [Paenibacillus sp. J5C2022]MCU6709968.1 ABC-2 transporter permease [Paenibacillus sp. J5C2022]